MRDKQQSAVYEAETLVRTMFDRADQRGTRSVEVLGSTITLPVERKFGSVESVRTYCEQVLALNWVGETWPRATVSVMVRARAGNTAAHYSNDTIAVPEDRDGRWALRELVVLHELAHHLGNPDSDEASHGPEFVDRYLTLVDEIIGPEAAFVLRAMFLAGGVRTD
ncbi:TIGR04338 family metallohydrolase [Rhodococcus sp. ACPA4]|uniref:Putative metallohydrolase (TIGR04338 family) n=2 Tax=Nocardiaceae TaxID=85025 RepID=A0A652YRW2_NOCGL|nr:MULTISPECIES: TIGR04338 family metallohydrolase [Rhodococcus]NMD63144.1 TIGR04338 family metallohydrolase [Nocardia globerula]PBC43623.1 TIGR04338 family metallohydrolase [Rhodococcus sp. ACPA4]PVX68604.1 putative metallohydrolase (TIGR04338 family) [Rhodococcus globerulus]RZL26490.1 MAG: TIGR04338 family metallohydrolase [Rhodococcus sp. (in: high G+C Gram-positive bacteria)]